MLTATSRRALGRALASAGALDAAIAQLHRALADAPASAAPAIRASLAELTLRRGRFAEAANLAAAIDDDDPHAGLACRIECAALIADARPAAARDALERADRVGLPDADRDLLTAWCELSDGGEARSGLSIAVVPLLVTLAELMLGASEPARFGELRELLTGSRLAEREQIELIAEMQRRHGDVGAAASEWLSVCAERPDARARLGLARIAAAQGMTEDAAVFASAALELDPECSAAQDLLTALTPTTALDG